MTLAEELKHPERPCASPFCHRPATSDLGACDWHQRWLHYDMVEGLPPHASAFMADQMPPVEHGDAAGRLGFQLEAVALLGAVAEGDQRTVASLSHDTPAAGHFLAVTLAQLVVALLEHKGIDIGESVALLRHTVIRNGGKPNRGQR